MVVAYLRVSTGKQHLKNQCEEIKKYAIKKNLSVDKWYTEVASGKKKGSDRKLGTLLRRLTKGDILIVTELSRLSRTLLEIMSILNQCIRKEVVVYSVKDGYAFDNNINSKVLGFAFGLVAEIEHNLISARTREALALRKSEGVVLGRRQGCSPKAFIKSLINRLSSGFIPDRQLLFLHRRIVHVRLENVSHPEQF